MTDKKRKTMAEHIEKINKACQDEQLTTASRMTIFSWLHGLVDGIKNVWVQTRQQDLSGTTLGGQWTNLKLQVHVAAFLREAMAARVLHRLGLPKGWQKALPDGTVDKYDDFKFIKNMDGVTDIPQRAVALQELLFNYSSKRRTFTNTRAAAFSTLTGKFKTSMELRFDSEYILNRKEETFVLGLNQFLTEHSSDGERSFRAKPWSMMQGVSVFMSVPWNKDILCADPCMFIPFHMIPTGEGAMSDLCVYVNKEVKKMHSNLLRQWIIQEAVDDPSDPDSYTPEQLDELEALQRADSSFHVNTDKYEGDK